LGARRSHGDQSDRPRDRAHAARGVLGSWAKDGDLWVRRTALLAQHDALRAGAGDFGLFERIAASLLVEKEFFIRKAIGWVLREVSKKRPELVFGFIARHRSDMSGLTLREASKYLPMA
jgi:3-methyladenine DNA glycosylase AlkD